jgi:hypothetical protein
MTDKAVNMICAQVWFAASLMLDGWAGVFAWALGSAFLLLSFFHRPIDELPHRR